MNIINVKVNFEKGTTNVEGNSLISGDYLSTKLVFDFDTQDGTKIFEMKNPNNEVVIAKEIVDNEIDLAGFDEEKQEYYSLFAMGGMYIFEISLYDNNGKLTSAKGEIPVKQEQVILNGEVIEPYLPIIDELIQELDNLNIDAEKVDTTTTITITGKDGSEKTVQILDGIGVENMEIINRELVITYDK